MAEDVQYEVHTDGRLVPQQFLALPYAQPDVRIADETYQFGITRQGQYAIALPEKGIAHIDGKGITIEGVEGGLTITGKVAVLNIVVDK